MELTRGETVTDHRSKMTIATEQGVVDKSVFTEGQAGSSFTVRTSVQLSYCRLIVFCNEWSEV